MLSVSPTFVVVADYSLREGKRGSRGTLELIHSVRAQTGGHMVHTEVTIVRERFRLEASTWVFSLFSVFRAYKEKMFKRVMNFCNTGLRPQSAQHRHRSRYSPVKHNTT
ncbi:hypothetical protein DPMN_074493 [Dreissena polymorpha]|uniref:Uncharacterized protein n=1 Tax=Dreissena polymorpha TaxID=45954 RepID=A0A9D3YJC6_DREPO|nr:hypothetical protein DPMN_074493 [Dreissena polymorpha]